MKTPLKSSFPKQEKHFGSSKKPEGKRVMEYMLPADAVLFLYDHLNSLGIEMLVEKRDLEDYVILEIEENNKRIYFFQLLVGTIRGRFTPGSGPLRDIYNRKITDLLIRLKSL